MVCDNNAANSAKDESRLYALHTLFATASIFATILAFTPACAQDQLKDVRVTADGAGPSHLFWLAGPMAGSNGEDIIGIVDPLYAAVRLYGLQRPTEPKKAFSDRLRTIGACSLPVSFRPWRVHHLKSEVLLESVPDPGKAAHNVKPGALLTKAISIQRNLLSATNADALIQSEKSLSHYSWNPLSAPPCGAADDALGKAGRMSPVFARRAKTQPLRTIELQNRPDALSPTEKLTVRARNGAFRLYSATELEPAGNIRVVQITEGQPADDGILRVSQRILTFSAEAKGPIKEIAFDETVLRSKLPARPIAVMPTGELLVMGRQPNEGFKIQSCGLVGDSQDNSAVCSNAEEGVASKREDDGQGATSPTHSISTVVNNNSKSDNATTIFARVGNHVNAQWEVDTSGLPQECRSAEGCSANGQTFVALRGIRLTRGIYKQKGTAYAMTDSLLSASQFLNRTKEEFSNALADVKKGSTGLPGNLQDDFSRDLGVDCSALVQLSWAGEQGHRLSTKDLQTSTVTYRCKARLPSLEYLRPGDAIGIYVKPGPNHVVLFGSSMKLDGANDTWLVLESASACDGVCWSFYDPAFFNGWGLYRSANRKDASCIPSTSKTSIETAPMPSSLAEWRQRVLMSKP